MLFITFGIWQRATIHREITYATRKEEAESQRSGWDDKKPAMMDTNLGQSENSNKKMIISYTNKLRRQEVEEQGRHLRIWIMARI